MTANTVLSDINELHTGFELSGRTWDLMGADAKNQYDSRVAQAQPAEVEDAIGKSQAMADEFLKWANQNSYSGKVIGAWWTARPGSMASAVGRDVDQRKNPTDILIKFQKGPADGFLGLSAKATKTKGDIGFKNPGLGTVDKSLGLKLVEFSKKEVDALINELQLPKQTSERKTFIRANAGFKKVTEAHGVLLLAELRKQFLKKLTALKQPELIKYLLSDWMDAELLYPPYIKVTGMGNKAPYTAKAMNPVENDKLKALNAYPITLEEVGNESVGVKAGIKKIMKMRFKFESEKMASSIKLSGDPW